MLRSLAHVEVDSFGEGSAVYWMQTDPFSFEAKALLQGLRVTLGALAAPRQRMHLPAQRGRLLLQLLALLLLLKSGLHHAHTFAAACSAERVRAITSTPLNAQ